MLSCEHRSVNATDSLFAIRRSPHGVTLTEKITNTLRVRNTRKLLIALCGHNAAGRDECAVNLRPLLWVTGEHSAEAVLLPDPFSTDIASTARYEIRPALPGEEALGEGGDF